MEVKLYYRGLPLYFMYKYCYGFVLKDSNYLLETWIHCTTGSDAILKTMQGNTFLYAVLKENIKAAK